MTVNSDTIITTKL